MKTIFKQKNRFICLVLACCVLASAFLPLGMLTVHAEEQTGAVAKVGDTEYENYLHAWNAVKNGGTITMLADWNTTELLTVAENTAITINMNGHMINRGLSKSKNSGEIFLVKKNGVLELNGNGVTTTEHWGTVNVSGKWTYQGKGKGNVVINGSLLTGGYNGDGGAAIHIQESAEVKITGVTIAGNIDDDKGGAIRLQGKYAKLTMTDSVISYNIARDGGGAAIRVQGADSSVKLVNTKIHHNHAETSSGDGGAIYINNGSVEIVNSVISFNEAGRKGGAIYVYNGNLSIDKDSVLSYNVSNKEGGAVYADSKADKVNLEGYYVGNSAAEEGGAVYVNCDVNGQNGVHIGNAEMIGNIAFAKDSSSVLEIIEGLIYVKGGGAVYVDSDNDISLYGEVIMQGNSPDNLHIRDNGAIKENNMTDGSRVGIEAALELSAQKPYYINNPRYFTCDRLGYDVAFTEDAFYFVNGEDGAPSSYKVGNAEYVLTKSLFCYTAMAGGTMTPYFFYSDGYFAEDPKYYNEHLASFAASMALAAMPAQYEGEYSEDKVSKNITGMFAAMGFSDIYVHYPKPEYFGPDAENLSTIGYAIAKKTVMIDGKETTIIATAVRGADYFAEWASNVTLGSGVGEAQGFSDAAKQVKQGIDAYIAQYGIDTDSSKFFITGYSRAGATSNLVAKRLTDTYGEERVYAYCIEAPKGGVFSELKEGFTYTNIHNIISGVDIVTTVGPAQMGFIRYGVDHMVPEVRVGSQAYNEQKRLMLAQLAAINENIQYDDYFHEATLEYILSKVGIFNMISENYFTDFDCPNDWIPYFIEKLQEYAFSNLDNGSGDKDNTFDNESDEFYGYRNFWSDYEWYLYFDENDGNKIKIKAYEKTPADADKVNYTVLSVEDAIANIMQFYFGSSDEVKNKVINSLDLNSIMANIDMMHIYTVIIDEWNDLTIDEKNTSFHKLWSALGLEDVLKKALMGDTTNLSEDEKKAMEAAVEKEVQKLVSSFYVVLDFLLDFIAEDYDETDQDILGTLVHNVGRLMQNHYHDVAYSWVRSYDSYYSDIQYVCKHNYGEWLVLKEATEEDYGVQKKTCEHCREDIFEAIPKIVNEKEPTPVAASLFGTGSSIAIILCALALIVEAVAIYLYVKFNKKAPVSQDDEA